MKADGKLHLFEDAETGFGRWIIESEDELNLVAQLSDRAWTQAYQAGLRLVYLSEDVLAQKRPEQLTRLHQATRALRYLVAISIQASENEVPPQELLRIEILSPGQIAKIKQAPAVHVDSSRRNLFRAFLSPGKDVLSSGLKRKQIVLQRDFLPHSPLFDFTTCTACDACAKICPSHAIRIQPQNLTDESSPTTAAYVVSPEDCDACGLCESVCRVNAISTPLYQKEAPLTMPLIERSCWHCQHVFRLNPVLDQESVHCPSCRIKRHARGDLRIIDN